MLNDFLTLFKLPEHTSLIYAKVWGSHSHNTNKDNAWCKQNDSPESDIDYSGVYIANTKKYLGMSGIQDSYNNSENVKPDYAFHEIGKFCNLLLVGNPAILEMLFTERLHYIADDSWVYLRENRNKFLSKKAVESYIGYASAQLSRLKKGLRLNTKGGEASEKWMYHFIRLLYDAKRIVRGDEPLVWKTGEERERLMNIRYGKVNVEEIEKEASTMLDEINTQLATCQLPDVGDSQFLEKFLVDLRLKQLS